MIKFQLVLSQEKESIVLEENESKEYIEHMLNWYKAPNKIKFFNGEFSIMEITI